MVRGPVCGQRGDTGLCGLAWQPGRQCACQHMHVIDLLSVIPFHECMHTYTHMSLSGMYHSELMSRQSRVAIKGLGVLPGAQAAKSSGSGDCLLPHGKAPARHTR